MQTQLKRWQSALIDCRIALSKDIALTEVWYIMSNIKVALNDLDSARYFCSEGDKRPHEQLRSYATWSAIDERKCDYEALAADMSHALVLDPQNAGFHNNMGWTRIHFEQYEQALEDFNEAIALDSKMDVAYNNKAFVLFKLLQFDSALIYVNRSIEMSQSNALAFKNRALILLAMKKNGIRRRLFVRSNLSFCKSFILIGDF